jgi:AraC-like DNA-binding protein
MARREQKKFEYFPNPAIPIGLWNIRNQEPIRDHEHDFIEIAIVTAGTGEHNFQGTALPVKSGDVFVVNAGDSHAWKNTHAMDLINLMINDFEAIPELSQLRVHPAFDAIFFREPNMRNRQKGKGRLHLNLAALTEATQLTKRLDHALHQKEPPFPLIARVIFLDLVSLLCESYMLAPQEEHRATLRISEAIRHLEANMTAPPDHAALATITHTSVPTFYRLFRLATGTTPANYVNRLRVREAIRRLRETDQTITAIAYDIGFDDSNYFSTVFHKIQGMSPREFRNQQDNKNQVEKLENPIEVMNP